MPSIKRGDIIKILMNKSLPSEIIIVDGVFDSLPSITHKEILLALSKNIKVIGISSMGALRGSELFPFGMEGYGEIFELYLRGDIESDEEVAVSFTKRKGRIVSTIPLINIRKTVEKNNLCWDIYEKSKKIFYKQRSWARLSEVLSKDEFALLQSSYIDQKQLDVVNYFKESNINTMVSSKKRNKSLCGENNSFYFSKQISAVRHKNAVNFIIENLKNVNSTSAGAKKGNFTHAINVVNFLHVNRSYVEAINHTLIGIGEVFINSSKITNFKKEVLKALNINNVELLSVYLEQAGLNFRDLNDIFLVLFKLYHVFLASGYSKTE